MIDIILPESRESKTITETLIQLLEEEQYSGTRVQRLG
jgi:hypothetical protein